MQATLDATFDRAEPLHGLVRLDLVASAANHQLHEASSRFELCVDGEPVFSRAVELRDERCAFWLGLNTFLLPDGENELELAIKNNAGVVSGPTRRSIRVLNDSALGTKVKAALRTASTPLIFDGSVDSSAFPYGENVPKPWFESDDCEALLETRASSGELSEVEHETLLHFCRQGYAILPYVLDAELVAEINRDIDRAVATGYKGYEWGSSQRLQHLHEHSRAIHRLWVDPVIRKFLRLVFEVDAIPCQTLTYVFGSQQDPHQDTVHLTPFPAGFMCGVWVSLEDVAQGSGELVIYPGSHKWQRIYVRSAGASKVKDDDWREFGEKVVPQWREMIEKSGVPPLVYRPRAGSVLVWHENLMHGGRPREDRSRSRRSIVSHYFADGSAVYYDSLGTVGAMHYDQV